MAARTKSEQFRVNAEEKAHLHKAGADAGFPNTSAYLRELTLARTVVTFAGTDIVLIPAFNSSDAHDKRIEAVLLAALKTLNGQTPSQPSVGPPGGPPAPPADGAADSAPADPPAGGVDPPVVGASQDAPPAVPAPASPPPGVAAPPATTGAPPTAARPDVPVSPPSEPSEGAGGEAGDEGQRLGECPQCGGVDGNHQSFCETVTGEPPVEGTASTPATPPVPAGSPIETRRQFIARRGAELLGEGQSPVVATAIAEAEWRKVVGQPTSTECPNCGTVKLDASKPCPDCGA